jgi:hypothetical protein
MELEFKEGEIVVISHNAKAEDGDYITTPIDYHHQSTTIILLPAHTAQSGHSLSRRSRLHHAKN